MKINNIIKLSYSLNIEIDPVMVNNALVDTPIIQDIDDKFTDKIDLIVIENYSDALYKAINKDSLKGIDLLNVDSDDIVIIDNIPCQVIVIFDGFIRLRCPDSGKAKEVNCHDFDYIPF